MSAQQRDAKLLDLDEPEQVPAPKAAPEAQEEPRETLKPSFDVERYAEDVVGRERLPTIIDEVATEEARIASVLMDSDPPARESSAPEIQIAVQYSELDALGIDEQLAVLRARLAPMKRVPSLSRKLTELGPLIEDPKTAYVLGFVDGLLPLETIVEVAGLPEIETLRILDRAIDHRIVKFQPPPP